MPVAAVSNEGLEYDCDSGGRPLWGVGRAFAPEPSIVGQSLVRQPLSEPHSRGHWTLLLLSRVCGRPTHPPNSHRHRCAFLIGEIKTRGNDQNRANDGYRQTPY